MILFSVNVLATLFGALALQPAGAASHNELLWTGSELVNATSCQIVERFEIPFSVAILRKHALIKIEGPSKLRPSQDVRVSMISSSELTSSSANKETTMPRIGVASLRDQVLEIRPGAPAATIGKTKVVGTYWQAAMNGERFVTLECQKKSYVLFDVFSKDVADPIGQIGVNENSIQILRSAVVRNGEDAEKDIEDQKDTEAEQQNRAGFGGDGKAIKKESDSKDVKSSIRAKNLSIAPMIPKETLTVTVKNAMTVAPSLDYVVCVKNDGLQIRSKNLKEVLFIAGKLESVHPLQTFGSERQSLEISGVRHSFINVKFDDRGQKTGWVAESYIKLKSECPYSSTATEPPEKKKEASSDRRFSKISRLSDSTCCNFPVRGRPKKSYLEGMRRFRASRRGGRRLHAACDIYRSKNEDILAVAPGIVLRKYAFYQGTSVMEVIHPGGFIVLYGEITGKNAPHTRPGSRVKTGQVVGYMGKVNSNCCQPMLHFELYSGKGHGPMLGRRNVYRRRSDLINPTAYLRRWEKAKFGQSF